MIYLFKYFFYSFFYYLSFFIYSFIYFIYSFICLSIYLFIHLFIVYLFIYFVFTSCSTPLSQNGALKNENFVEFFVRQQIITPWIPLFIPWLTDNATEGEASAKPYRPLSFSSGTETDRLSVSFYSPFLQTKPGYHFFLIFSFPLLFLSFSLSLFVSLFLSLPHPFVILSTKRQENCSIVTSYCYRRYVWPAPYKGNVPWSRSTDSWRCVIASLMVTMVPPAPHQLCMMVMVSWLLDIYIPQLWWLPWLLHIKYVWWSWFRDFLKQIPPLICLMEVKLPFIILLSN